MPPHKVDYSGNYATHFDHCILTTVFIRKAAKILATIASRYPAMTGVDLGKMDLFITNDKPPSQD